VFAEFGLTPEQQAALDEHLELLLKWNKTVNLTAIRDRDEAIQRHYGESLFLAFHLPAGPLTIADVGSGAGFPGLPVAIARPDCRVTLIESHQRKSVFLREAARKLPNVRVLANRAEDVQETFDHVISRAVSYVDLSRILRKVAPVADLLTGVDAPPVSLGFLWDSPIPLPSGDQRFLWIGRRI